jgi:PIN domain nuclease of toxin-antitoxin system
MLNLDTHILLYALAGDLSRREATLLSDNEWSISAIVLWEIAKLSELRRIEVDLENPELVRALARIQTWPLTLEVCRVIQNLDFKGDPADEIIGATSMVHKIPLVTRDRRIARSKRVPLAL